jgi:hypothetical protein
MPAQLPEAAGAPCCSSAATAAALTAGPYDPPARNSVAAALRIAVPA